MSRKKDKEETTPSNVKAFASKHGLLTLTGTSKEGLSVIPTGNWLIDNHILGTGGLPRGRVVEVYGPNGCGKSTLCYHIVANAQAMGLDCLYIDAEHSLDPTYAAALGVDPNKLHLHQPMSGEDALALCIDACKEGCFGVVVLDSLAAMSPEAEIEAGVGANQMGLQARLLSKFGRMVVPQASATNTLVLCTNQTRKSLTPYTPPITTPGGEAMKFYASVRLELGRGKVDGGYQETRVKNVKNKLAPPYRQGRVPMRVGAGFDNAATVLDLAEANDVVTRSGAFWTINGTKIQGRQAAIEALSADAKAAHWLEEQLVQKVRTNALVVPGDKATE